MLAPVFLKILTVVSSGFGKCLLYIQLYCNIKEGKFWLVLKKIFLTLHYQLSSKVRTMKKENKGISNYKGIQMYMHTAQCGYHSHQSFSFYGNIKLEMILQISELKAVISWDAVPNIPCSAGQEFLQGQTKPHFNRNSALNKQHAPQTHHLHH